MSTNEGMVPFASFIPYSTLSKATGSNQDQNQDQNIDHHHLVPIASFIPVGFLCKLARSIAEEKADVATEEKADVEVAAEEEGPVLDQKYFELEESEEIFKRMAAAQAFRKQEEEDMEAALEEVSGKDLVSNVIKAIEEHDELPYVPDNSIGVIHEKKYHKIWSRLSKSQVEDLYSKWIKQACEELGSEEINDAVDARVQALRDEWVQVKMPIIEKSEEETRKAQEQSGSILV